MKGKPVVVADGCQSRIKGDVLLNLEYPLHPEEQGQVLSSVRLVNKNDPVVIGSCLGRIDNSTSYGTEQFRKKIVLRVMMDNHHRLPASFYIIIYWLTTSLADEVQMGAQIVTMSLETIRPNMANYMLATSYNHTNFLDSFEFFESKLGTGSIYDVDPTGGYVQYQNQSVAEQMGLVHIESEQVFIGVDTENTYDPGSYGRKSIRLQSWDAFNHGLLVANFTHLPTPTCGAWPAFWTFGWPWPDLGEFDIMENWNSRDFNRNTAMINGSQATCSITAADMSSEIESYNCDAHAPGQYWYQGCSSNNFNDTAFGSPTGGVYVLEWTDSHAKVWSWPHADVPQDLVQGQPSPTTWGTPAYAIVGCDMYKGWRNQRIVLNIGFCGVAGQDGTQPYTKNHWEKCAASTGCDSCTSYVAKNPGDFVNSYFLVKDIVIYRDASADSEVISENHYGGPPMPTSTSASKGSTADATPAVENSANNASKPIWAKLFTLWAFSIATMPFTLP